MILTRKKYNADQYKIDFNNQLGLI